MRPQNPVARLALPRGAHDLVVEAMRIDRAARCASARQRARAAQAPPRSASFGSKASRATHALAGTGRTSAQLRTRRQRRKMRAPPSPPYALRRRPPAILPAGGALQRPKRLHFRRRWHRAQTRWSTSRRPDCSANTLRGCAAIAGFARAAAVGERRVHDAFDRSETLIDRSVRLVGRSSQSALLSPDAGPSLLSAACTAGTRGAIAPPAAPTPAANKRQRESRARRRSRRPPMLLAVGRLVFNVDRLAAGRGRASSSSLLMLAPQELPGFFPSLFRHFAPETSR
jgi:hypothetical protein